MKKIFSSLAVLAILLTAVACNHDTSSIYAEGSISGKATYDAGASSSNWSNATVTLNLSGASFAADTDKETDLSSSITVYSKYGEIEGLTFKVAEAIKKGDKSAKITISGTPNLEMNYNGSVSFGISNADTTFDIDEDKLYPENEIRISGELEIKNYASATASISDTTITISLTGSTVGSLDATTGWSVTSQKESSPTSPTISTVAKGSNDSTITITLSAAPTDKSTAHVVTIPVAQLNADTGYKLPTTNLTATFTSAAT